MAEFSDAKSGAYCMCTREKCSDECRTYRQFRPKPITNADRIRAMNDEELAKYISNRPQCPDKEKYGFDPRSERCDYGYDCDECWLDWLKQETS